MTTSLSWSSSSALGFRTSIKTDVMQRLRPLTMGIAEQIGRGRSIRQALEIALEDDPGASDYLDGLNDTSAFGLKQAYLWPTEDKLSTFTARDEGTLEQISIDMAGMDIEDLATLLRGLGNGRTSERALLSSIAEPYDQLLTELKSSGIVVPSDRRGGDAAVPRLSREPGIGQAATRSTHGLERDDVRCPGSTFQLVVCPARNAGSNALSRVASPCSTAFSFRTATRITGTSRA